MNEIVPNAKMDPEIGPSTEIRPEVAPESVTKPTTELNAAFVTDNDRSIAEILGELTIESGADESAHHASQPTFEPASKAPANSLSAAEIPLPPSPPPPPGFSFTRLFPGELWYTGKSAVPDAEVHAEPDSAFNRTPRPRPYEMHSKQSKTVIKVRKVDISNWLKATQGSRESFDSCLRPSTLFSATAAPTVVTEDATTAVSDINPSDDIAQSDEGELSDDDGSSEDDTASYYTAVELQDDEDDEKYMKSVCELQYLQNRDFSEQQLAIISALDLSLQRDIPDAAEQAAAKIDSLCPPTDHEEEVEEWLWMLWETFLDVVRSPKFCIPHYGVRGPMQEILKCLQLRARGTVKIEGEEQRLWRDLPSFPYCMEACFDDPTTRQPGPDFGMQLWSWRSLNFFAADCLGGSVGGSYDQAMYAMTTAFEEELSANCDIVLCRLDIVSEWICRAGDNLFRWALENSSFDGTLEKDSPQYVEGGPLYHGPPMMCLQRWGFWTERLEQLSNKARLPPDTAYWKVFFFHYRVDTVLDDMRLIEERLGRTL